MGILLFPHHNVMAGRAKRDVLVSPHSIRLDKNGEIPFINNQHPVRKKQKMKLVLHNHEVN